MVAPCQGARRKRGAVGQAARGRREAASTSRLGALQAGGWFRPLPRAAAAGWGPLTASAAERGVDRVELDRLPGEAQVPRSPAAAGPHPQHHLAALRPLQQVACSGRAGAGRPARASAGCRGLPEAAARRWRLGQAAADSCSPACHTDTHRRTHTHTHTHKHTTHRHTTHYAHTDTCQRRPALLLTHPPAAYSDSVEVSWPSMDRIWSPGRMPARSAGPPGAGEMTTSELLLPCWEEKETSTPTPVTDPAVLRLQGVWGGAGGGWVCGVVQGVGLVLFWVVGGWDAACQLRMACRALQGRQRARKLCAAACPCRPAAAPPVPARPP